MQRLASPIPIRPQIVEQPGGRQLPERWRDERTRKRPPIAEAIEGLRTTNGNSNLSLTHALPRLPALEEAEVERHDHETCDSRYRAVGGGIICTRIVIGADDGIQDERKDDEDAVDNENVQEPGP